MRSANLAVMSAAVIVAFFLGMNFGGQPAVGKQAPQPPLPATAWRYQTTALQGQLYAFIVTDTQTGQAWGHRGVRTTDWDDLGMPMKEKKR